MPNTPESENILGTHVHAVTLDSATELLEFWAQEKRQGYICPATVYSVMTAYRDAEYCRIVNGSKLTIPDGMPLVWFLKLRKHQPTRVHGPDLMLEVCKRSPGNGLRHYLLGGAGGQAGEVAETLWAQFPRIEIVGITSTPKETWSAEDDKRVVSDIRASGANIVWVGMGTPWQDQWAQEHTSKIGAPLVGMGSAFDFISGRVEWAPQWIQQTGFQWLFRLLREPRRLWGRYLWNNPLFVFLSVLQLSGIKKFQE